MKELREQLVTWRREIHRHAEPAWLEVWTASYVAHELTAMGYAVRAGEDVVDRESRVAMPSPEEIERARISALAQGADKRWVDQVAGGFGGVVVEVEGSLQGPTVAMRFDIDANNLTEADHETHRPARLGFRSLNEGACHACGHDGHAAIGLGVASALLGLAPSLAGRVRLIFQPAEEGSRGARAMLAAGVLDNVDYFLTGHIGFGARSSGTFVAGTRGFLATSKADVVFKGVPAHAGASPERGRNALLAAAAVSLALHALPRHSGGASRINVGQLQAGEGRNVIPAAARLAFETRGSTTEIDSFLMGEATRAIEGMTKVYGVDFQIIDMGGAPGSDSDAELVDLAMQVAADEPLIKEAVPTYDFGASEDATYMMEHVRSQGGKAAYMMFGADLAADHHNSSFDFDEDVLMMAVQVYLGLTSRLLAQVAD